MRLELRRAPAWFSCVVAGFALIAFASPLLAQDAAARRAELERRQLEDRRPPAARAPEHETLCVGGFAGTYPCDEVDLLSVTPLSAVGAGGANDNANEVWGWTDPATQREYALLGLSNGTAFLDITVGDHPVYLGKLPTHSVNSLWRSIKVYANHAFIVSEASDHGMQVFDLTRLRTVTTPPVVFTEDAHYAQFGRAHTLAINEESGYAYAVGSRQGTTQCSGGLHMVDIRVPTAPVFAGCFSADFYTHETQCVNYHGPDTTHQGREICFACNEDTLTIVDVTNKSAPVQLSRTPYAGSGYTHQGWLTEDHSRFLLNDELDESNFGHPTRTYVWNVADLDAPSVLTTYNSTLAAIDHNLYIRGSFVYQANYRAGLRILKIDNLSTGQLSPAAHFDIYPANDQASFNGAWMVFPYFPSGNVVVAGIEQGLFVLRPNLCAIPSAPAGLTATAIGDNRIDLSWGSSGAGVTYTVLRSFGGCPGGSYEPIASGVVGTSFSDTTASGTVPYSYKVVAVEPSGPCSSLESACASATTTGACTAGPAFAGLGSAASLGQTSCGVALGWAAASPWCGAEVRYAVHRSTDPDFVPSVANRIVGDLTGTSYTDSSAVYGEVYHYVVRASDTANGAQDTNLVRRVALADGPPVDGTWASGAELGDPVFDLTTAGSAPQHAGWEISNARARAGNRSFFSEYNPLQCTAMTSPPISLTAGQSPELAFWTVYDLQTRFDGGVVELSADGGANWTRLSLTPGYPNTFNTSADACSFTSNTPAFTGTNLTWTEHRANLSAWAGQTVKVRFRLSTDSSVEQEGWYLDDVSVSHAQVPGLCSSGVFADGFESGDVGAWASAVP